MKRIHSFEDRADAEYSLFDLVRSSPCLNADQDMKERDKITKEEDIPLAYILRINNAVKSQYQSTNMKAIKAVDKESNSMPAMAHDGKESPDGT